MELFKTILIWFAIAMLVITAAYVIARVASIAFYRTVEEYERRRRVRNFINGESDAKRE